MALEALLVCLLGGLFWLFVSLPIFFLLSCSFLSFPFLVLILSSSLWVSSPVVPLPGRVSRPRSLSSGFWCLCAAGSICGGAAPPLRHLPALFARSVYGDHPPCQEICQLLEAPFSQQVQLSPVAGLLIQQGLQYVCIFGLCWPCAPIL